MPLPQVAVQAARERPAQDRVRHHQGMVGRIAHGRARMADPDLRLDRIRAIDHVNRRLPEARRDLEVPPLRSPTLPSREHPIRDVGDAVGIDVPDHHQAAPARAVALSGQPLGGGAVEARHRCEAAEGGTGVGNPGRMNQLGGPVAREAPGIHRALPEPGELLLADARDLLLGERGAEHDLGQECEGVLPAIREAGERHGRRVPSHRDVQGGPDPPERLRQLGARTGARSALERLAGQHRVAGTALLEAGLGRRDDQRRGDHGQTGKARHAQREPARQRIGADGRKREGAHRPGSRRARAVDRGPGHVREPARRRARRGCRDPASAPRPRARPPR